MGGAVRSLAMSGAAASHSATAAAAAAAASSAPAAPAPAPSMLVCVQSALMDLQERLVSMSVVQWNVAVRGPVAICKLQVAASHLLESLPCLEA